MPILVAALFFAMLTESMTEYFVPKSFGPYLKYVAAVVGVGLSLIFQIDLVGFVLDIMAKSVGSMYVLQGTALYVSYVLSGLIIGRGSNYVNDIVSRIRGENGTPAVQVDKAETVVVPKVETIN